MLYVSLWKIALSNLPGASFTKRSLPDCEARTLIATARAAGALRGVSAVDLGAPYERRNYALHVDVCMKLGERGIELAVDDFFGESYCRPLSLAKVNQSSRLLVVDCNFELGANLRGSQEADTLRDIVRPSGWLKVHAASVACYLFEAVFP